MKQKSNESFALYEKAKQRFSIISQNTSLGKEKSKLEALQKNADQEDLWKDLEKQAKVLKQLNEQKEHYLQLEELFISFELIEDYVKNFNQSDKEEFDTNYYEELQKFSKNINTMYTQLLFKTEDNVDCYISINAGSGGHDAQDFAAMLLRMYIRWCDNHKFQCKIIEKTTGEVSSGIKSCTLLVEGRFAYGWLNNEQGVHRLVRISPFNSEGKRHTSFVAVDVSSYVDEEELSIDNKDLKIETFKASGAGGQHVNTTESAIRITHIPSGTVVQCQSERSQHQNKSSAMSILRSRLHKKQKEDMNLNKKDEHNSKKSIDFGSQIRSYILHPYSLVKDHRTNLEVRNPKEVLDGELDNFIIANITNE